MDLCPSQRETSEIGTPSASAVLAKVMPQVVECGVRQEPGRGEGRLPDLAVVVVAPEQCAPRRTAQHVGAAEAELRDVSEQGITQKRGHGHVTQ